MTFVQVHPAEEHEDALAVGVQVPDGATVPRRGRRREAAEVRQWDLAIRRADRVGRGKPATAASNLAPASSVSLAALAAARE
jgi:hypothetical protein